MKGHPIFAFFHPLIERVLGWLGVTELRRKILEHAEGTIVEIGAGTGANFGHYPAGARVLATEPDPYMVKRARKVARAHPNITVSQAPAEALPPADGSVDTVVSTLVLCTVPDVPGALADIRRILRPGGKLLVLEHVRADDPAVARKQDKGEKMQRWFAAGCHPNRDTLAALESAGFDVSGIKKISFPGSSMTRPGILGVAVRP